MPAGWRGFAVMVAFTMLVFATAPLLRTRDPRVRDGWYE
jgi:hypothetical protein